MKKSKYSTVIDFGKSNLRLGVFNENSKNIFSISKDIIQKDDFTEHSKILNLLIRSAEKKVSTHLENIIVLYDHPKIFSIDLSIKKDFDQIVFVKDIYPSLIMEANQLISNNYINYKILHLITSKFTIDGKEYFEKVADNFKTKSIVVELKFLSLNKEIYNKISQIFKINNLQILNLFCTSYVKSFSYKNHFMKSDHVTFLDIGWERSTILSYKNSRLVCFNSVPLGGNHITKDISKVLKLNLEDSEKIKKSFNKSEIEFSFDKGNDDGKKLLKEVIGKNISTELLKKVVLSRIEEILLLVFKDTYFLDDIKLSKNSNLVLTGKGSILFDKNSFHLDNKHNFNEINFYEETDSEICNAGFYFNIDDNNEIKIINKSVKKAGFFEKFFNLFSR